MKYSPQQEKQLMTEIWSMNIKDDPVNFVKFIFPWGEKGTPSKILKARASGKKKYCGKWLCIYSETKRLICPKCLD